VPPRDEQDYQQRRQQIIDGALRVFASKGLHKATNKDIAQAAGIGSPGLIYHYFKDKDDLFRSVVEQRVPHVQLLATAADELRALPPQEALRRMARTFLQVLENREFVATFKLLLNDVPRHPAMQQTINDLGPGRWFPFLTSYLEQQMEAGTLRRTDAGAAARCFVGPLLAYIITHELFPQADTPTLSTEMMVETLIETFLHGMTPTEQRAHAVAAPGAEGRAPDA
jgi:AcrR family transcriptional regulator